MKSALVLGGNHFFGIKLVESLLEKGFEVTVLNRGNREDPFGERVKRIKCDRTSKNELTKAIDDFYDVVFDQCCFDYPSAKLATEVFQSKAARYIFTSSISAYNQLGSLIKEDLIKVYNTEIENLVTVDKDYGEAKKQAEIAFFKYANFPIVAVRFPIVLDKFDATKRLQFHIEKIRNAQEIYFPNLEAQMSFISADDAAKSLVALSLSDFTGPINVASKTPIALKDFISFIERETGEKFKLAKVKTPENASPYGIQDTWSVDTTLLNSLGIHLKEVEDYLPQMI